MTEDREITVERIKERAYELWDRNHRPGRMELQFWLLAERELKAKRVQGPHPEAVRTGSSSERT